MVVRSVNRSAYSAGRSPRLELRLLAFLWLAGLFLITSWSFLSPPWLLLAQSDSLLLFVGCAVASVLAVWLTWCWSRFPHPEVWLSSFLATLLPFLLLLVLLLFFRAYYSRPFLLVVGCGCFALNVLLLKLRYSQPLVLLALPDLANQQLLSNSKLQVSWLSQPLQPVASGVVVADLHHAQDAVWMRFLLQCAMRGATVVDLSALLEGLRGRVWLERFSEDAIPFLAVRTYLGLKRWLELSLLLVLLPVWLPLTLLVALLVRLDSAGPVLFFQERVGLAGRAFRMVKFRSMLVGADASGAQFASQGDARVTRVGRVIRKLRLDELPQLWNVLCGDMAIIGPRPEQARFVSEFSSSIPFYEARHLVRPGITGWAQVVHGYADSEDGTRSKLEYDLFYIKHFSFWLDVLVLLKTARVMLTGFGAR